MICDRCYQPLAEGEHGRWLCPLEPRRESLFPTVIPDTFPGGSITIHNMSAQPETFTSKSEHRRRVKELGLTVRDTHVGLQGSDRSPHTTRWI